MSRRKKTLSTQHWIFDDDISKHMPVPTPVYRTQNHKQTPYYFCVEDHLETLEWIYEDLFLKEYMGFIAPMSERLWSGISPMDEL